MAQIKIGYPCTPCEFIKRVEMKPYKVKMSCGGGLGGSVWNEYIKEDIMATDNFDHIVEVETIFGEKKKINLRYVVKSEQVRVINDYWDTTKHSNFHKVSVKASYLTRWIEVGLDTDIRYVNEYADDFSGKYGKLIKKESQIKEL